MKLYLLQMEFIYGEHGQLFNKLMHANPDVESEAVEVKVRKYFRNYYGPDMLAEEEDGTYFRYTNGVAVKVLGWEEVIAPQQIITRLLIGA